MSVRTAISVFNRFGSLFVAREDCLKPLTWPCGLVVLDHSAVAQ